MASSGSASSPNHAPRPRKKGKVAVQLDLQPYRDQLLITAVISLQYQGFVCYYALQTDSMRNTKLMTTKLEKSNLRIER